MAKYKTEQIRNVALLGHGGAGKTTLTEALLYKTGVITRMGRVEDGSTVSDWDAEEHRRGISINLSVIPVEFENIKLNLIDAPGYQDFVGEVISALHAAEAGLLVVDAVAGCQVGTELAYDHLRELQKPRIVFVNRMDRENANFTNAVQSMRTTLGDEKIVPFQIPIGSADSFKGIVGLIEMKAYLGPEGKEAPIPADFLAEAEAARVALVEAAAEADDELIMKYLEGEELTIDEVRHGLHVGVKNCAITPVYCGTATGGIGLERLMQALRRYVPAPNERSVAGLKGGAEIMLNSDVNGPVAGAVFKTIIDRYIGRMNYIRVFSGKIARDAQIANARTGKSVRVANLFSVRGKDLQNLDELVAGDIGVITKLDDVQTGDTLCAPDQILTVTPPSYPRPLYSVAVTPVSQADSAKMGPSLTSVCEEDPTLRYQTISATKQTVLQGMGETHVDVAVHRMSQKFGTNVEVAVPKVPYQETITKTASAQYRHKKQTGGAGQFAEVHLRVEPLPAGGYEFTSEVFGGAISSSFYPSIEKGIKSVMENGVIAGYPVVDVKAIVYDGKEHPVDSKDIAFQTAGREVFKLAFKAANPVLLEPIYIVEVTVPDEYMGDVMSDFNTRRGRVLGMEQKNNRTVVRATVPLAEIMRYSTDLRSMTQGRGVYTIEFDHYEPVPAHVAADIIAQHKEEASED
ncbi:MAG TPA: elongation factor G [Chloroflexi bacterium]|nr:elongation factor G [Chloroflexota bacterium]HHW84978.1 elongation factor G [Chloroflexota bacterium]